MELVILFILTFLITLLAGAIGAVALAPVLFFLPAFAHRARWANLRQSWFITTIMVVSLLIGLALAFVVSAILAATMFGIVALAPQVVALFQKLTWKRLLWGLATILFVALARFAFRAEIAAIELRARCAAGAPPSRSFANSGVWAEPFQRAHQKNWEKKCKALSTAPKAAESNEKQDTNAGGL